MITWPQVIINIYNSHLFGHTYDFKFLIIINKWTILVQVTSQIIYT